MYSPKINDSEGIQEAATPKTRITVCQNLQFKLISYTPLVFDKDIWLVFDKGIWYGECRIECGACTFIILGK